MEFEVIGLQGCENFLPSINCFCSRVPQHIYVVCLYLHVSSLYTLLQDSSDKELEFLTLVEESLRASQEDIIIPVGTMKTHIG